MPTFITESRPEPWNTKGLFFFSEKSTKQKIAKSNNIVLFFQHNASYPIKRKIRDRPADKEINSKQEKQKLNLFTHPCLNILKLSCNSVPQTTKFIFTSYAISAVLVFPFKARMSTQLKNCGINLKSLKQNDDLSKQQLDNSS